MSKVTISGNALGSGTLIIAAPNTSSDITLNLPTTMGTNNGSSIVTTNAAGNLGLGVAPSVNSLSKSLDLVGGVGLFGYANNAYLSANLYYDGGWKYKAAGFGTSIEITGADGVMKFNRVASGSAGAAATLLENARFDASGNLLVGTQSALGTAARTAILFDEQAAIGISIKSSNATTGGSYQYFLNSAGALAGSIAHNGSTTVAYNTSSDYRLKENIAPMTGALSTILQLKPCTYTWKEDGSDGQGFIAHELQAVVPDCVTGEKDAMNEDGSIKSQGIDTSFLVATLTAAIQELHAIVAAQGAEIATLTAAVAASKGTA